MNQPIIPENIKIAIDTISKAILDDPLYYHAWQSNIAIAFRDAMMNAGYQLPNLYDVSNDAADTFLAHLTMSYKERGKSK